MKPTWIQPDQLPSVYYSFDQYNTKTRMLTYWYQIKEVLLCEPNTMLEVGIGTGLVSSYIKWTGCAVSTFDINGRLNPDFEGSVKMLKEVVGGQRFDVVLCSRVLHHLPLVDLIPVIEQLHSVCTKRLVLTLPVDDFRVYFSSRITSIQYRTLSIPIPIFLKRLVGKLLGIGAGSGLWQINSRDGMTTKSLIDTLQDKYATVRCYRIPEDMSHIVIILDK